jgi:hypothetical protein
MRNHFARTLILLLVGLSNVSCMTWSRQGPSPQAAARRFAGVQKMRVTRQDGSRFVLTRPHIQGDSLTGMQSRKSSSILLAKVAAVDVVVISPWKTGGAVLGGFILFGVLLAITADPYDPWGTYP